MSFQEFSMEDIDRCKEKYAEEVKERWGGTRAYDESKKRRTATALKNGNS